MHGYDDDPRGLWEIDEARDYFCRWAKFAGLNTIGDAAAIPVSEEAIGVMAKCGAFEDIDPDSEGRGGPLNAGTLDASSVGRPCAAPMEPP
jgi:hypothetical protein